MIALARFAYTPHGTFGRFYVDDLSYYTVERPWQLNKRSVSCIPEGRYPLVPRRFNRGNYDAYEIMDVPDRSAILIHIGNTMDDLEGCVALGTNLGWIKNKWAVTASRSAFDAFMAAMGGREDMIDIYFRRD